MRSGDEIELWRLPADDGRFILLRFEVIAIAGTRERVRVLREATEPLALPMLQAQLDALNDDVPVVVHVGPGWKPSSALIRTLG
jgi:hypothetical protein